MTQKSLGARTLASLIATTVVSGGGSVFLFDQVLAATTEQLEAHVRQLEADLHDCRRDFERCEIMRIHCDRTPQ